MNAPPEVVVDVAMDPATRDAWLPSDVEVERHAAGEDAFEVRLTAPGGAPGGVLKVGRGGAGGATARLEIADGAAPASPEEMLNGLESQVVDRFNYG